MAYMDISANTLKKLIKDEIDESSDSKFSEYLITEATNILKDWGTNLDYNKIKKLQKAVNALMKEFDGEDDYD